MIKRGELDVKIPGCGRKKRVVCRWDFVIPQRGTMSRIGVRTGRWAAGLRGAMILLWVGAVGTTVLPARAQTAAPAAATGPVVERVFGGGQPVAAEDLPDGSLKSRLQGLPPAAKARALNWLRTFAFSAKDAAAHLRADRDGGIYFVCPAADALAGEPAETSGPGTASAPVPISQPPVYHSKAGAPSVIYLDFNGGVVTNTAWNSSYGVTRWDVAPYSQDSDTNNFSDAEQTWIRRVWERIAEDYAPFNVDVTTDAAFDPDNTGGQDNIGWLMICPTVDLNGVNLPHAGYGGIAYVGVFGGASYSPTYQPAWVSSSNGGGNEAIVAEAASHEMGHNMGLSHDGTSTLTYYGGHGATSEAPSWGPIMGTGYNRNVSQWCKGEYYNANLFQDDLAIISGRVAYRTDDHGNTFGTATELVSSNSVVSQTGRIETTGETDVFAFTTAAGPITISAAPYKCDADTWGGNLDIALELYDSTFTLITATNPAANVTATLAATVSGGRYYVVLKPVGAGNPTNNPPSGYTVYSSLGQYTLTGTVVPTSLLVGAGTTLAGESCSAPNGVVDPAETVTVQFAIQNVGASNTVNLVGTLLATNGVTLVSGPQTYGVVTAGGPAVSRSFTFTAEGLCGGTIQAKLQLQDGATDYGTLTFPLALGVAGDKLVTNVYSTGGIAFPIPDTATVDVPITVAGSGVISNVHVRVRLNHTYDGDLVLSLVHPDGTEVTLADRRGGSGDNFGSGATNCSGTFTVFADSAATAISAGAAPFAGTYRPESVLAAFTGKPVAGTWYLRVADTAGADIGTVYCVQLDIAQPASVCCEGGSTSSAFLANLVPSAGALQPAFVFDTFAYTDTVPFGVTSLTVTPTAVNTNAAITVNGQPVASGAPSAPVDLGVGDTLITTVVVSEDLTATNTYTLTVTRQAGSSNAALADLVPSTGLLSPAFASNTFLYAVAVPFAVTSLTLTPTAADAGATITVNGDPVASGTPSDAIALGVGDNLITTRVVAENLTATNDYVVTVTRAPPGTNALLANLVPSAGTLAPAFDSDTFSYSADVSFGVTSLTVTPTAVDPYAAITVNGVPVGSGNPSGPISLNIGPNLIATQVVAEDGNTTNTYSLTVTRAPSVDRWWDGGSVDIATDGNGASNGGTGTWSTAIANWDEGASAHVVWNNDNNNVAVFGGTVGLVTVATPVTVGGLSFTTAGYIISNNTVTLTGDGTVGVTTGTTTIKSAVEGSVGLLKTGAGALTLSASNLITGAVTIHAGTLTFAAVNSWGGTGKNVAFTGSGALASSADGYNGGTLTVHSNLTATINPGSITFATTTGSGTLIWSTAAKKTLHLGDASTFMGTLQGRLTGNANYGTITSVQFGSLGDGVGSALQFVGGTTDSQQSLTLAFNGSAPLIFSNRQVQILDRLASNWELWNNILANNSAHAANKWVIYPDLLYSGGRSNSSPQTGRNFVLSGSNTGDNEFAGRIHDGTAGGAPAFSVQKTGSGAWILSSTNSTYTGTTTINGGTLTITSLRDVNGGPSSLGNPPIAVNGTIKIGSGTATATLRYIGSGDTSDRIIHLAGTTGGAALEQAGSGLWKLTGDFTAATGAGASRTLTLLGSTEGMGEISGAIPDGSPTNLTALTKSGTGTWILSGQNTYRDVTTVGGGTLLYHGRLAGSGGAVTVNGNATLGGTGVVERAVTVSNGGILAPGAPLGTFTVTSNVTLSGGAQLSITLTATEAARLAVSNVLTLTGATLQCLTNDAPTQPVYILATYGSLIGTFNATNGIPPGYTLDYAYNGGTAIALVAPTDPPPVITGQPADQLVCNGNTALFTVAATGANLAYQWQHDGADLTDGGSYQGVTTAELTVFPADTAAVGQYRCRVSNSGGSVTSSVATLTLKTPTAIVAHPVATEGCLGTTAQFTVTATGAGLLHYQWQKDDADLGDDSRYSGTTSNVLTVADLTADVAGDYRCLVTAECGSQTSSNAALTVLLPVLLVNPTSVNFGAVATGTTAQSSLVLSNAGCGVLVGTASAGGPFAVVPAAFSVAPGETTNLVVEFTPPAEDTYATNVLFLSNGGPSAVPVAGTGAAAPVASFDAAPLSGPAPLLVTFTDTSTGTITNRFWQFGDGATTNTTATTVAHTYTTPGSNIVELVVSGPLGNSSSEWLVVVDLADTDGDGLPDAWETANGLDPNNPADADADPDGDGFTSRQEYAAGTHPQQAASALRIIALGISNDNVHVWFTTEDGRLYDAEHSADLTVTNIWSVFTNNVPGTGAPVEVVDPGGAAVSNRFYRIRLVPQ